MRKEKPKDRFRVVLDEKKMDKTDLESHRANMKRKQRLEGGSAAWFARLRQGKVN